MSGDDKVLPFAAVPAQPNPPDGEQPNLRRLVNDMESPIRNMKGAIEALLCMAEGRDALPVDAVNYLACQMHEDRAILADLYSKLHMATRAPR